MVALLLTVVGLALTLVKTAVKIVLFPFQLVFRRAR